ENHGIRLAKFLNVEVDPALPPLHFELTASHSETIRDPAFPVAIQVTANQPVSAAIVLDLELSGDAQPVIDFQPFPLFVEIPAGETSAHFPLIPSLNSATETSTLAIRLSPENPHPVSQNP